MKNIRISLVVVSLAGPALAQTDATFVFTSSNTVSPSSPTTTIEIWATWADPEAVLQFGLADYDFAASEGLFSNPVNVLRGPASSAGEVAGNTITGAINGQILLSIPPWGPPDNPIILATYDWTTTDFTPRTVDLLTSNTSTFMLGDWRTGGFIQMFPQEFTPGSGVINVVPVPAAWLALALPLVAGRRRRR